MTIERGRSSAKRASFRCLNLAWTLLAFACAGDDLGPTTPPGATSEGKSGSATSTVTPAPVFTSVSITPATASVVVGLTTQLTASAQDQNGAAPHGGSDVHVSVGRPDDRQGQQHRARDRGGRGDDPHLCHRNHRAGDEVGERACHSRSG